MINTGAVGSRSSLNYARGRGRRTPPALSTMNAIIDYVRSTEQPPGRNSREDAYGSTQRPRTPLELGWVRCTSQINVPAYGIVGVPIVQLGPDLQRDVTVNLANEDTWLYAANERYPLYANQTGWVKLIRPGTSALVMAQPDVSLYFLDRLTTSGYRVKLSVVGDLVVDSGYLELNSEKLYRVTYDPQWSWVGTAMDDATAGQLVKVKPLGSDLFRKVYLQFGECSQDDVIFVGRGNGRFAEDDIENLGYRWYGVMRPCPQQTS